MMKNFFQSLILTPCCITIEKKKCLDIQTLRTFSKDKKITHREAIFYNIVSCGYTKVSRVVTTRLNAIPINVTRKIIIRGCKICQMNCQNNENRFIYTPIWRFILPLIVIFFYSTILPTISAFFTEIIWN